MGLGPGELVAVIVTVGVGVTVTVGEGVPVGVMVGVVVGLGEGLTLALADGWGRDGVGVPHRLPLLVPYAGVPTEVTTGRLHAWGGSICPSTGGAVRPRALRRSRRPKGCEGSSEARSESSEFLGESSIRCRRPSRPTDRV